MAFFSPLRLGKQRIPILVPVNEWPEAIPGGDAKRERSALDRHSERGITENWICERSELRGFFDPFF